MKKRSAIHKFGSAAGTAAGSMPNPFAGVDFRKKGEKKFDNQKVDTSQVQDMRGMPPYSSSNTGKNAIYGDEVAGTARFKKKKKK